VTNYTPGHKYNKWELQGVPLRIEIGPRDCDNNTITLCKRTDFTKSVVTNDINIDDVIDALFKNIHQ
jgi:prolyl-tRNA synthetase